MPHSIRVSATFSVGVIFFTGVASGEDLMEGGFALLNHPDWQPGFDEVWDLTDVTQFAVAPDELKAAAAHEKENAERLGNGRAITISDRFFVRALHRLFETVTRNVGRRHLSYATREDAALAIDVDPAVFDPD